MKVTIQERKESRELLFFMTAETVSDAAQLIRLAGSTKECNSGYVNFSEDTVSGWVAMPLTCARKNGIKSGKWR